MYVLNTSDGYVLDTNAGCVLDRSLLVDSRAGLFAMDCASQNGGDMV